MFKIILRVLLILLFSMPSLSFGAATSFYVFGGSGSDSGGCNDSGSPCNTLAYVDDQIGSAELPATVYIKGTFSSQQYLNNATEGIGTDWANAVTYQPWTDANVIFNDAGNDEPCIRIDNKRYIVFNGFYGSTRRFKFYDGKLGIHGQVDSDYVKITGCEFSPSGETKLTAQAIMARGVSDMWYIYDNLFYNGSGTYKEHIYLGIDSGANDFGTAYIYDNEMHQDGNANSEILDVKRLSGTAYFYDNTVTATTTASLGMFQCSGGDMEIYDNSITWNANIDGGGMLYFTNVGSATSIDFYRNTVTLGGNNISILVHINTFANAEVFFYSNIFKNLSSTGGHILDFDHGGGGYTLGTYKLYHNTFYNCSIDGLDNDTNSTATIIAKNNIFNTCDASFLTDTSNLTSTWDGNYYYKSGSTTSTNLWTWNGAAKNWSNLNTDSGQEANGNFGNDPNLDANGKLQAALPVAVDVSSDMSSWPGYNKDIDGMTRTGTWDIGADEWPTSAALTGTYADGATEAEVVAGTEGLVITLVGDTWAATMGTDVQLTKDLIAGIDSGGSEAAGWDAEVKGDGANHLTYLNITRTNSTVVTIDFDAEASYNITSNETITVTVPASALAGSGAVVATPTFGITATLDPAAALTGTLADNATEAQIVAGGETLIITLTNDTWVAAGATFDGQRQAIIDNMDSAQSEATGWDAEVKGKEVVTAVVRTNDTVVTITLTAQAAYDISANESITVTVPAAALVTSGSPVVATPTYSIIFFDVSTEKITGMTMQ